MFFPTLLVVGCIAFALNWKPVRFIRDKLADPSGNRVGWCKLYSSALFVTLTIMHVAINCGWPRSYGIMISTAMLIYLAHYTRTVGLAKAITNRKAVAVFLMTVTLAVTLSAYWNVDFLSSALTLAFILLWSLIYPDYKFMNSKKKEARAKISPLAAPSNKSSEDEKSVGGRKEKTCKLPRQKRRKNEDLGKKKPKDQE